MFSKKSAAEKRLADLFMDDLPVMEWSIRDFAVAPDWFAKYKNLRREFMRSLTDSIEDIAFLYLSHDEFMGLIMGRAMPVNLSLRLRVPLVWGGKLEISNMFLCKTFPHSHNMDRFIIEQTCSGSGAQNPGMQAPSIIWLPNPAKKIYIPAHTISSSDGGNATEDRLSQLAAQLANGNNMG
ncbi:MAG: hypothetical protein LBD50_00250 [Rickettsiales bacterium]|jgi:hypothetical protein|nr:hypothetical protein [Rickettsiales bacterium]